MIIGQPADELTAAGGQVIARIAELTLGCTLAIAETLTTKIHALVDANGLPVALKLTEG